MKHTKTRQIPAEALSISALPLALQACSDKKKKRRFDGVANSGAPLSNLWLDEFVIDLASLQLSERTAGLYNHDFDRPAAAGKLSVQNDQLVVEGEMLDNEHGRQVVESADQGFPWQMSVYVDPGSVEKYESGTSVTVNGRTLSGPISVLRNSQIHEFSFTPVGVDHATSARMLSHSENHHQTVEINEVIMADPKDKGGNQPTIETLTSELNGYKQQLSAAKADADKERNRADNAEAELTKLRADKRAGEVRALLSAKGVEYTEEAANPYLQMSDDVWAAVQGEAHALLAKSATQPTQQLPQQFFQPETGNASGDGAHLSAEPAILANAKARAAAAA